MLFEEIVIEGIYLLWLYIIVCIFKDLYIYKYISKCIYMYISKKFKEKKI